MKIEHLQYLLEIIECNSFNKASKSLHINNQHLARSITSLEDEIGVKILNRNHKGVEITKEGQIVVDYAKDVVEKTKQLLNHFHQNTQTDHITIYSLNSVNSQLFSIIQSFSQQYPNVSFNLEEHATAPMIQLLQEHQKSIAFLLLFPEKTALNPTIPEEFHFEPLYQGNFLVIGAPSNSFISRHKSTSLKSLLKQDLLIYDAQTSAIPALLASAGTANIKYTIGNINTFYKQLDSGNCVSLIFNSFFSEKLAERYIAIPLRDDIKVTAGILAHKNTLQSSIVIDFIAHIRQFLHLDAQK